MSRRLTAAHLRDRSWHRPISSLKRPSNAGQSGAGRCEKSCCVDFSNFCEYITKIRNRVVSFVKKSAPFFNIYRTPSDLEWSRRGFFVSEAPIMQQLISYDALAARGISLSKCQLWRLEKVGKFPKRVPVTAARHAWLSHEIDDWIASRVAAREQVAA
jgi:prophage regulatory protein